MENSLVGAIGGIVFLILVILGVHIGIALGVVGLVGIAVLTSPATAVSSAVTTVFYFVTEYTFILLPFFILMGIVAGQGGISRDLYSGLDKWIGNVRGGAAIATVFACALFGLCTGSAMVAAVTFTRVSAPSLRELGYDKRFVYGLIASSGAIAMLIPPSALAVIYGLLSGESVGKLLIGGIGPGVLMTLLFTLGVVGMIWMKPSLAGPGRSCAVTFKERVIALYQMWPVAVIGGVVIGGIYLGVFTVVEAGAVASFAILVIGFSSGHLSWKDAKAGVLESVNISVMVFFIFASARLFSRFLALSGVSAYMANTIIGFGLSPIGFVIGISIIFIILGCFLDSVSMLCIMVPLLLPVVKEMKIDPIWFAMVVIVAIHIGLITPPVGLNVFATKGVAESDVSLEDIFAGVLPFFFLMVATLALVIAFPAISSWLPSLIEQ